MKYFILQIILVFFSLSSSAQQSNISVNLLNGPEHNQSRDYAVPQIFGHDGNGYFASADDFGIELSRTNKKVRIPKCDS